MMVAESGGGPGIHEQGIHPTDLSPRSSVGSESSVRSDSQTSSPSPNSNSDNMIGRQQLFQALNSAGGSGPQFISGNLSPLQRLQYAFEQTTILSNLFLQGQESSGEGPAPLLSPPSPKFKGRGIMRMSTPYGSEPIPEGKHQPIPSPPGSPNSDPAIIFQCPLCSIVCNGRHSFNEHIVTHSDHLACPKCDYLTDSEEKLRDHLQGTHDLSDPIQGLEEEETSVPKLNAQGKVKTFKCKQCDHFSMTKSEFWTHAAKHIRPEKMLKCPKCSFVTEYKHHLEYHLRIHVGSKPYQCNVCSYTCVNKSMLNSHLKSHSAVYQYNCLDCDYQTKYCHSLKMHLRKLNHRPSMVLNPDGTPNPLPIIDVYGTRRGPKMKKSQPVTTATPKPLNQPMGIHSPANSSHGGNNSSNGSYSSHGNDSMDEPMSPKVKAEVMEMPPTRGRKPKDVGPPVPTPKRPLPGNMDMRDGNLEQKFQTGIQMSPSMTHGHFEERKGEAMNKGVVELSGNPLELYAAALNQYLLANPLLFTPRAPEQLARMAKEHEKQMAQLAQHHKGTPQAFHHRPNPGQHHPARMHPAASPQLLTHDPTPPHHQAALDLRHPKSESERRRRKGKAHRYERHDACEEETFGDVALDFSNNNYKGRAGSVPEEQQREYKGHGGGAMMMCKYCEISFPDQILYRMHMSYHSGEQDPFVCKSCGKKTQDKVDFFLHLTTDSH